jgi:GNAT superfamily N-acetyltransferase
MTCPAWSGRLRPPFRLLPEQVQEPAGSSTSASKLGDGDAIVRHLLGIDAAEAWAAVIDGDVVGVAMAGVRDGLWYLAQLHLDPVYHGRGLGSRLLQIALDYGVQARGMLLHSSLYPRAMRCYQRAGFALEPALHATGRLCRSSVPPVVGVRAGDVDYLDLVAHVDRVQRGGAHGPDLELLLSPSASVSSAQTISGPSTSPFAAGSTSHRSDPCAVEETPGCLPPICRTPPCSSGPGLSQYPRACRRKWTF